MTDGYFSEEHEEFREVAREFNEREVAPHYAEWDEKHMMDRSVWTAAAEAGLVGLAIPEEFGGMGLTDYRFRAVMDEEFVRAGHMALGLALHLHDDWVLPHILAYGTQEQKTRWLPGMLSGELVTSVAFTEPGAGSDLRGVRAKAVRNGDHYVLNGQKTFIGNGISGDAALVLARTDGGKGRGSRDSFSLFLVEKKDHKGYTAGNQLDKMGLKASDTAELFFDDVEVPAANLIGEEGKGLDYVVEQLPQGRLAIAVAAVAVGKGVLAETVEFTSSRNVFGERVLDFQNTQFELAELSAELEASEAYVQRAIERFNAGELDAVAASKVKLQAGSMAKDLVDRCLQLHGGFGYIVESSVAQAYMAVRLLTIFGGTNEILKDTVGRSIAASVKEG
ncbi:acyl-CoA dehydrogenase family protein [Arthrobacter sp. UM1]|uniref:acyl-CoA dehydrogenase family protein n=1 Tax=Arthrobacter sp. UM1 TaxID=2766776 RepID=UPI001CF60860|nr:acyl-CoA dehydrogenase family protein [Arthrobacter sp. UM1]MCB4208782.1 acyl-CoA dehydrogenase family protein [Arthrobacter sp. UM1]